MNPIIKIEKHPFFIGVLDKGTDINIPDYLPFNVGIHPKYAIPVLILDEAIQKALDKAYAFGSMASTPLGESVLSTARMNEVLEKLLSVFGDVDGKKILEIGCGSGLLLNELKKRGAVVTGLEIGPQGQEGARRYGFDVISSPLTSGTKIAEFDCIYSSACLEHIIDLEDFFAACGENLKTGGLFFHSVPNSEYNFENGNSDHLVHEHVNYFSGNNGKRLLEAVGFKSSQAEPTKAQNEMFLWGYWDKNSKKSCPGENEEIFRQEKNKLQLYADKFYKNYKSVIDSIIKIYEKSGSIGFYAGGFEYSTVFKNVRYFDGDPYKHGKSWLSGLSPIESPENLITEPVKNLIVFKNHYYENIVKYLKNEIKISEDTMIYNIKDLKKTGKFN